jgi:ABC-type phosphate transport system substrate-binding protein
MNMKRIFGKKLVKNAQAVSPIIATLMLVLVAVGSAGAFYVWQSGWQGGIEDKVSGSGDLQASLTIGGSSTVYEFSAVATEYYHAANPNYRISYQKGGSGAGIAAVGTGAIDIGSASKFMDNEEKDDYPDLNKDGNKDFGKELVEHVIAWDAVAVVTSTGNSHGLVSIDEDTLYDIYATNGNLATHSSTLDFDGDGTIQWDEVPTDTTASSAETVIINDLDGTVATPADGDAAIIWYVALDGTTPGDYALYVEDGTTVGFQEGQDIQVTDDLDDDAVTYVSGAEVISVVYEDSGSYFWYDTATPAEIDGGTTYTADKEVADMEIASDGTNYYAFVDANTNGQYNMVTPAFCTGSEPVTLYDRDDKSGTEEVFAKQIIDTSEKTLEAAGITNVNHEPSNQDLLTAIAGDDNAISFMSFGMAGASGSGLSIVPFQGDDNTAPVTPDEDTIMDEDPATQYVGARPIVYITVGEPTGDIAQYIDFCMQPGNNIDICKVCDYISIYA